VPVHPQFAEWSSSYGICTMMCDFDTDYVGTCEATAFAASSECELTFFTTAGVPDGCVLTCTDDTQCPSDQRCLIEDFFGEDATQGFCYPYP